jgi:hypothetical protein
MARGDYLYARALNQKEQVAVPGFLAICRAAIDMTRLATSA